MKNSVNTEATTITLDLYQEVTNKIISMIEQGEAPWRRTWSTYGLAPIYKEVSKYHITFSLILHLIPFIISI